MQSHTTPTIVMTGASGYLGSRILKIAVEKKLKVIALCREEKCDALERVNKISNVSWKPIETTSLGSILNISEAIGFIHAATSYGRNGEDKDQLEKINYHIPKKLLEELTSYNSAWCINIDTCLDSSINEYARTKGILRDFLKTIPSLPAINIEMQQFYGAGDNQLISRTIRQLLSNIPSIDLTDGLQKRDFLYIDDAIDAIHLVISRLLSGEYSNGFLNIPLGTNEPLALKEVIIKLKEITNSQTELHFGAIERRASEPMILSADIALLKSYGWVPKVSFNEGARFVLKAIKE